jgi:trimethylamine:corrinoid methyltransferase-like protein
MKRSTNSAAEGAGGLLRFGVVGLADVERIHELSLRVLAETGILLHYPSACQLLADHGASVDKARQVVRIPRQLVEQALASAPREVTVYSQSDPRQTIGCAWMARTMRAPPPR